MPDVWTGPRSWLVVLGVALLGTTAVAAQPQRSSGDDDDEYQPGLIGTYTAAGATVERIDPDIAFDWKGASPDSRLPGRPVSGPVGWTTTGSSARTLSLARVSQRDDPGQRGRPPGADGQDGQAGMGEQRRDRIGFRRETVGGQLLASRNSRSRDAVLVFRSLSAGTSAWPSVVPAEVARGPVPSGPRPPVGPEPSVQSMSRSEKTIRLLQRLPTCPPSQSAPRPDRWWNRFSTRQSRIRVVECRTRG
ncbi:MAG: hypothetical protein CM1200mP2_41700 [Planctomycetaceae bacterium]|nr:MAG: hypothetical protein CM1200mP2_41700 [Planctomycetaceae bacterium]